MVPSYYVPSLSSNHPGKRVGSDESLRLMRQVEQATGERIAAARSGADDSVEKNSYKRFCNHLPK
jgi:hypothetical protein